MTASVSVSWHRASSQYIKTIGATSGKDGCPKPKAFYLGKDKKSAIRKAIELKEQWDSLKSSGARCWEDATSQSQRSTTDDGTIEQAAKSYLEEMRQRYEAGQISCSHYRSQSQRLYLALRYLDARRLEQIDAKTLNGVVLKLASRPKATKGRGWKHSDRGQMSAGFCKSCLSTLKWFLQWADDCDIWQKPKRFNRIFKVKIVELTDERIQRLNDALSTEPKHFSIEQLKVLYGALGNDRHRLWMLLALNCGFCGELGDLRRYEVKGLSGTKPYIERIRRKTGVVGRWMLWTETATMLRRNIAGANDGDYALLTDADLPLIEEKTTGRRNAIGKVWYQAQKDSGVVGQFKLLRKTGAWMIKTIGGRDISEMYLAHQEPGMNRFYAGRQWDKLDDALDTLRSQLLPMLNKSA